MRQLRVVGDRTAPQAGSRLAGVRQAADRPRPDGAALEQLIWTLAGLALHGERAEHDAALELLLARPALLTRLDEHARRSVWRHGRDRTEPDRLVERLEQGAAGPLVVALASTHGDGRIRQQAVSRMLAVPRADLVPFLVLRTTDWVPRVRALARGGLAVMLHDNPGFLPSVLGLVARTQDRRRGDFAGYALLAGLLAAGPKVRHQVLATADPQARRYVHAIGLAHGWLSFDDLLALARDEPDPAIRVPAAEQAARQAVWTSRLGALERLAGSGHPEVRAIALTGLVRAGRPDRAAGHLDDVSALVRALARDVVRRAGGDPVTHYRAAVGVTQPPLGAIDGLGETGSARDAALLAPLLQHPASRVRAAAVRALGRIGGLSREHADRMLHDPSPRVVRQTAAVACDLPVPDAWALLEDSRVVLRRAGYRLLRGGDRPVEVRLRAAERARQDGDPRLAHRAGADLRALGAPR